MKVAGLAGLMKLELTASFSRVIMLASLVVAAAAFLPAYDLHLQRVGAVRTAVHARTATTTMMSPEQQEVEECLLLWDEDEDGPFDQPMSSSGDLDFALSEKCSAETLPKLEALFDTVIGESDEACCTIDKMKKRVKNADGWSSA